MVGPKLDAGPPSGYHARMKTPFHDQDRVVLGDPAAARVNAHDLEEHRWNPARPRILVVACSDGRLQEETDHFLQERLGVSRYDRLYLPGGAGALSPSGFEFHRARQVRHDCHFLVESHGVRDIVLLFHGPTADGPAEAACADYVRKLSGADVARIRAQQEQDAEELLRCRREWALEARVHVYRCEISAEGTIGFMCLHAESEVEVPGARARG